MTIEIRNPEIERIVNDAVRSGRYQSAQEVVAEAVSSWHVKTSQAAPKGESAHLGAVNLFELFAPVRGLLTDEEIDRCFSRNPSLGRPVDLA